MWFSNQKNHEAQKLWIAIGLATISYSAGGSSASSRQQRLDRLNYKNYPTRSAETAAIIEWGNSAIISAVDASVAQFGPQTNLGAFFEVEGTPILADPIDGNILDIENGALNNADDIAGNLVVMTNNAGLSGIEMATVAKNSEATALIIVNTDHDNPDFIYSIPPGELGDGSTIDVDSIDIPIVMISLSSGNVLTSVNVEVDENGEPTSSNPEDAFGMPDTIRLYSGAGRPFFEDISNNLPVVYLIHHMLTDEECDSMVKSAKNFVEEYDGKENLLEGTEETPKNSFSGLERTFLWKGMFKGQEGKQIEERMEQVTGFPKEHFSDFQVNKYSEGGHHKPHIDQIPMEYGNQMVSMLVFLNDDYEGGEIVYHTAQPPVKIKPRKGMALVHHNTDQYGEFDISTMYAELTVTRGEKWTSKAWVYTDPLDPERRTVLPAIAAPFGGKLPSAVRSLHNTMIAKFGISNGSRYFSKIIMLFPSIIIIGIAMAIIQNNSNESKIVKVKEDEKKRRKKKN